MPNPYQQQVRNRKLIYFLIVVVLFTISLIYRRQVVEPAAYDLYLRETARGQVELTSTAVSYLLSGSKGLTTTILWFLAQKAQERHEWDDLELLVSSITTINPHFVTPWVFQSWNLAFNVAVEWDRPLDKYYYIAKGIKLLADGERRHEGTGEKLGADTRKTRFPGNPDMRFHIANFYMLKIGTSDEKNYMRSLLDLSILPPERRDPNRFTTVRDLGGTIKLNEFEIFCRENPRLVRRVREKLGNQTPLSVLKFLKENQNLPNRFQTYAGRWDQGETPLLKERDQFPILPPAGRGSAAEDGWPNPQNRELTSEGFDVFLAARTWFQYAQKPLPPPAITLREVKANPLEHRIPKQPAIYLFRSYPALAQTFIADNLQQEGWFDNEGWYIRDWFEKDLGDLRVGDSDKYDARLAWRKAFNLLVDYGEKNGLYITPAHGKELYEKAAVFARKYNLPVGTKIVIPENQQDEGSRANEILYYNKYYRDQTNFDSHFAQAEAERASETALAKKYLFQAERLRRFENAPEPAIRMFQKAIPLWWEVLLRYPDYGKISLIQEDTYETEWKYLGHVQRERTGIFRPLALGMWDLGPWPSIPWYSFLDPAEKNRVLPIRNRRGPFSWTIAYDAPNSQFVREALIRWTQPAGLQLLWYYPGQQELLLVKKHPADDPYPPDWRAMIPPDVVQNVRSRLGLDRGTK